jgi:hypothetical protein
MRHSLIAAGLCLFAWSAFAQSDRGTITGTVSDPAGAVIASAPIQARNVETGALYDVASSTTGNYTLSELPAGIYEIAVTVPGFKKSVRQGLTVQVAQTLRIDIALEVGAATESVTVQGDAPLLKTESGDLSHNLAYKYVDDLPMWTISGGLRSMYNIVQLLPGTYQTGQELRISGAPNNTQSVRVEGQEANNAGIPATPMQGAQSVDAIQEVTVQTSNYAAEYGQAGGGVINMTMKSGTNQFHGSGYDYFVNEAFNAGRPYNTGNPDGNPRARVRRNDYGFTAGGPVWIPKVYNGHDKTFFFFNFEQFRETQTFKTVVNTVPTAAYRLGDFTTAILPNPRMIGTDPLGRPMLEGMIYDPATTRTVNSLQVRDPFPNNQINPLRFDPLAVKIQSLFPQPIGPQAASIINNFQPVFAGTQLDTSYAFKIDQAIHSKGKLSYYYSHKNLSQPISTTFGNADGLPDPIGTDIASFIPTYTMRLNYDHTLSPTTLLHLGAGYFTVQFYVPSVTTGGQVVNYDAQKELGLKGGIVYQYFPAISGLMSSTTGGMKNIGSSAGNLQYTQRSTFNASITVVRNNHTYKFGGELKVEGYPVHGNSNTTGTYVFSPAQTGEPFQQTAVNGANVGFGYASFLLGLVQSANIARPVFPKLGKNQTGLYAQDSWKVTRKLTLDYGLRYDYSTYLREQYGRAPFFSRTAPNPTVGNIPGAMIFDGSGPGHCNCDLAHNYPWAFGPRLGLAFQINPKTVFRGGFGIVYNGTAQGNGYAPTLAGATSTISGNFGEAITTLSAGFPVQSWPAFWPNYNPGQYPLTGTPASNTVYELDPNAGRPARQYQWSVGLQREIFRDLVAEAEYVGNRGIWWESNGQVNLNAITPARLKAFGLDVTNPADQALLTSTLGSAVAAARGFNKPPYPGFPTNQLVAQALRPYPQFTNIAVDFSPLGNTWYDSLQTKLTKRFSHGLSLLGTFSWSKTLTIGTERDPNPGTTGNASYNDVFNRQNNKYLSIYDSPFQFTASATYVTPAWKTNKVLSWLTRDWTYGAVVAYRSGLPMPVPYAQGTPNLNSLLFQGGAAPNSGTFANRVPGEPLFTVDLNCHCFDPNKTYVLNPKAWAQPAPGTFGTSAAYYGDYRKQRRPSENMSIGRTFRIKERASLNIRLELNNVFNRAYFNDPRNSDITEPRSLLSNGNVNPNSGFGAINTTTQVGGAGLAAVVNISPRNGVLVARLTF